MRFLNCEQPAGHCGAPISKIKSSLKIRGARKLVQPMGPIGWKHGVRHVSAFRPVRLIACRNLKLPYVAMLMLQLGYRAQAHFGFPVELGAPGVSATGGRVETVFPQFGLATSLVWCNAERLDLGQAIVPSATATIVLCVARAGAAQAAGSLRIMRAQADDRGSARDNPVAWGIHS